MRPGREERRPAARLSGDHRPRGHESHSSVTRSADSLRSRLALDRLLCLPRPPREPSTYGLSPAELADERDVLRTFGGRSPAVVAPWSWDEIEATLDLRGVS